MEALLLDVVDFLRFPLRLGFCLAFRSRNSVVFVQMFYGVLETLRVEALGNRSTAVDTAPAHPSVFRALLDIVSVIPGP